MSIYPKVSQQDLYILSELANQLKNERANEFRNRILKQTHDKKLAENLPLFLKKLDTVNETIEDFR